MQIRKSRYINDYLYNIFMSYTFPKFTSHYDHCMVHFLGFTFNNSLTLPSNTYNCITAKKKNCPLRFLYLS